MPQPINTLVYINNIVLRACRDLLTKHTYNISPLSFRFSLQVLSALDILQPPHLDFFQEMYPFYNNTNYKPHCCT